MGALHTNAFGPIAAHLERRIREGTQASAADLIAWIAADMSQPKSGTHWPDQPNVSSAPGESPAIQSQALVDSLHAYPLGATDRAVAAGTDHAADLEYGSAARHLAPHPFLIPGAHAIAPAHFRRLEKALRGKDPT